MLAGTHRTPGDVAAVYFAFQSYEAWVRYAVAAVEEETDWEAAHDVHQAGVVIARLMRRHDDAELAHAQVAERPVDACFGHAAVEQHGSALRVADERRVALAHVEEVDRQMPGGARRLRSVGGGREDERGDRRGERPAIRRRKGAEPVERGSSGPARL